MMYRNMFLVKHRNTTIQQESDYVEWYKRWKVCPYLLYGIAGTIIAVLLLEFMKWSQQTR